MGLWCYPSLSAIEAYVELPWTNIDFLKKEIQAYEME